MISRKAYEIAEVIGKQHGLITLELTSEQVLNWYEHLSDESTQQGNHSNWTQVSTGLARSQGPQLDQ